MRIPFSDIVIVKEPPGVISETQCWVCFITIKKLPYLYTGETFIGMLKNMFKYWGNDNSLCG